MTEENFSADPTELARSGRRFTDLGSRVALINHMVNDLANNYLDAGGDGPFGESFKKGYFPSANASQDFINQLDGTLEKFGDDTVEVADIFDGAESDAATNANRR